MNKITTISSSISMGRQSIECVEILSIGGHKVRIHIKSDAYDFQSYAVADIWSPAELKWNRVSSIHYSEMSTPAKLIYMPANGGSNPSHYRSDRNKLVELTKAIIL